jgi:3-methyladenine DNA glycosylase AlkD
MIEKIIEEIKVGLSELKPDLTEEKISRMYKIINPDISGYKILGVKTSDNEKLVKAVQKAYNPSYKTAKEVFRSLNSSNTEEYKFAAFFFLNQYKRLFDGTIPEFFRTEYFSHCHTWSTCDSCCIRVLGPFLARNPQIAQNTIDSWSNDPNYWIKRASLVLHLKVIMINQSFDETYVIKQVEQMLIFSDEPYIEKAIGWLLKTCTKYNPNVIIQYLYGNRKNISRLILRYATEKLTKDDKLLILKK